jgi:O-antigen/teichoic acid export membrane protein
MSRVTPEDTTRASATSEADGATRGSAIKLAAEMITRLITFGTTVLIINRLGADRWDAFGSLWFVAPLVAELAEFGLQATASRALVAGSLSLRALARARLVLLVVVMTLVLAVTLTPLAGAVEARAPSWLQLGVLSVLVLYFALSGWGEFLGVALRCRGGRVQEGLVLLVLRAAGLALAALALFSGAGNTGLAGALAVSAVPALLLGAWLLRRHPAPVEGHDAPVGRVLALAAPLAVYAGLLLLSPRVEFFVLRATSTGAETGLFLAALNLFWPLSLVPSAVASGAMPELTREAQAGEGLVRRRTSALLALFAAPAAVGLFLVAPVLVPRLLGQDFAPAVPWLRILTLALIPMFINGLVSWALIAAERASQLPRLVATRIVVASVLALVLVPRFGATGAAAGFVASEIVLLLLGLRALRAARFPVPVARPVALALALAVPMAFAVGGVRDNLFLALAVGVVTWGATVAAAWQLLPGPASRMLGARDRARSTGKESAT